MRKKVVITGAAGNLGRKLSAYLRPKGGYELVMIDRTPLDDPAFVRADLALYDSSWVQHLAGAHAVVHLAAVASPRASWAEIEGPNIDAVINVYEAAVAGNARRVVFASSTQTMAGYRYGRAPLTPELPPKPENFYAMSKLVGERMGRLFAQHHGASVICLRIGTIEPGDNPLTAQRGAWQQGKWLSNRDWCQGAEKAIEAEDVDFAVVYLTSGVEGSRWDLAATRRIIGYEPEDGIAPAPPSLVDRLRSVAGRWKRLVLARTSP